MFTLRNILTSAALGAALLCLQPANATATLTLTPPGGAITGKPGDTIGWGFTLTNNSATDWIIVSSVQFLMPNFVGDVGGGFGITPDAAFGTFTDFAAAYQFNELAPLSSITEPFDPSTFSGVGSFALNPSVTFATLPVTPCPLPFAPNCLSPSQVPGKAVGFIDLTYDSFDSDPLTNPNYVQTGFSDDALAAASIGIPEPATLALFGLGLVGAGALRRRLKQRAAAA